MTEHSPHTISGEAGPCFACGQPCYPVSDGFFRHGELCGELMRHAKEPCARRKGHHHAHRTAYAMANWANPTRWMAA